MALYLCYENEYTKMRENRIEENLKPEWFLKRHWWRVFIKKSSWVYVDNTRVWLIFNDWLDIKERRWKSSNAIIYNEGDMTKEQGNKIITSLIEILDVKAYFSDVSIVKCYSAYINALSKLKEIKYPKNTNKKK